MLFANNKKVKFRSQCLKLYISILWHLQMRAIFIIRTSGRILVTFKQSDAFSSRNEWSLASSLTFSFHPQFSSFLFLTSLLSTQHMLNHPVTAQHCTLFSSWLCGAMFPLSCWYPCCAPYSVFIRHWLCRKRR
jgi:hypothetical protein